MVGWKKGFQLFYGWSAGLIEEKKTDNECEGIRTNGGSPSGFWTWQVSNQNDALDAAPLPFWSLKTLIRNPEGVAGKTFWIIEFKGQDGLEV